MRNYLRPGARQKRGTEPTGKGVFTGSVGSKVPGIYQAKKPSTSTGTAKPKITPKGLVGGVPGTKSHAILMVKAPPKTGTLATPGVPAARSIRAPQPLGPQAQKQVTDAESAASRVMARHRSLLGVTRSVFPSLYGADGRPAQIPGMRKQVIQQRMQSPYKSSFTFGTPRF